MATLQLRSPLRHLRHSGDNFKTLQQHSNRWWHRCRCIFMRLQLNDSLNHQCRCAVLPISSTEEFGWVLLSRSCQFIKLHLLLTKPLHLLLHVFSVCTHHQAGFVIFAQLALLSVFIILIFSILAIVGTCKITQAVSHCNHPLLRNLFGLSVPQFHVFSFARNFLLRLNRCRLIFNSLSSPSGDSLNIVLKPFCFLIIVWDVCFSLFPGHELLFGTQAGKCPKGSDSFCFQAVLAFIPLMTSLRGPLCWFAIFAREMWRKVLFWNIDHSSLPWLCCWARCWMLQDMNNMEASFVLYVKVGTFTHLEQSTNSLWIVNETGIDRLTVQHDLIASVSFM